MTKFITNVLWLVRPFSVFSLFHSTGKEYHCQDDSTSDWDQIGVNLAISELHPVISSRCTYQVCYILRKTPRLVPGRFSTSCRGEAGNCLLYLVFWRWTPTLASHVLGASLGRRVQSRQEVFFEEIYVHTFPALHSTFPDLNNSFSMWARQLL